MKTIVSAIQKALKDNDLNLSYLRDSDVFISPFVNYVPDNIKSHAIGIVPGNDNRSEKMGGLLESKPQVNVVLWLYTMRPDEAVISTTGNPGILDFTDDVDRVLDENLLGIAGIESAFCRVLSAPKIFQSKESRGRFLIQRVLVYEYEQEVSR